MAMVDVYLTNMVAVVGAYVTITNRLAAHHERIKRVEDSTDELKTMVREVVDTTHEIRRLLAANRIQ